MKQPELFGKCFISDLLTLVVPMCLCGPFLWVKPFFCLIEPGWFHWISNRDALQVYADRTCFISTFKNTGNPRIERLMSEQN